MNSPIHYFIQKIAHMENNFYKTTLTCLFFFLLFNINLTSAATWEVGPTRTYTAPSQVAGLVSNGDTVAIDAGTYSGDVASWYADNLVLIGIGGKAHLQANGNNAQGKAIWVISGSNNQVINIEFSGATVPDNNGAGIRQQGTNLTISHCYFHDNENGILAASDPNSTILVEYSEFANNGYGQGFTHNIYINNVASFILQHCYMHHAKVGHNVKSRANQNIIRYNRIMDENTGYSSMLLDLSNGGESLVIGNLFHQGANAINNNCLTYGVEGLTNPNNELYVVNNTFVNNRATCDFVVVQPGGIATLTNNVFAGVGNVVDGTATQINNVNVLDPTTLHFIDLTNFDYNLTGNSTSLINMGAAPGNTNSGLSLHPDNIYLHPQETAPRPTEGPIDVGAYEYVSDTLPPVDEELTITLNGNSALCQGDSAELSIATTYTAFLWSTGEQVAHTITVTEPGIYSVTVIDATGTRQVACQVITVSENCAGAPNKVIITEAEGITTTNYPVQIARPFKEGEIAGFPQVLINGNAIQTQALVQTRWNDGSVKHAILNFLIPQLSANHSLEITFQNQSDGQQTGFLTPTEMLQSGYDFDAEIKLEQNGNSRTASARQMLTNGDFEYWLKGEVATSIILQDHSITRQYDMGFDTYRSFRPLFYVTFWHATQQVDIRYVGEITNSESLQDMGYALELFLGNSNPSTVYTKSDFNHHALSRWTKRFWLNGEPGKTNINHYLPYLVETTLIPNYDTNKVVPPSEIEDVYLTDYNSWTNADRDINENGNWTVYMPTTGGRRDIGPYPTWVVQWLYTGDWRMLEQSGGNADLAGAWPMHMREGNPTKYYNLSNTVLGLGKPISIRDRPTFWFTRLDFQYTNQVDRVTPVGPHTNGGWTPDNAHQPDPYSLLYMLTGEFWYWEQLNFWSSFGASNSNGSFTTGTYGRGPTGAEGGIPGQVRGQAWLFRTRVRAAMLAPDNAPEKRYFSGLTNDAIATWEGEHNITNTRHYQSPSWNWGYNILSGNDPSPLYHWRKENVGTAQASCLDLSLTCEASSPWMDNFLLFALGRGEELGYESELIRQWMGTHLISQLTHPDYDPYLVSAYRIPTTSQPNCEWYTSWADMAAAYGAGSSCAIPINEFNARKNNPDHGYTNIAMAASAYVTDLDDGDKAWDFMAPCLDNPLLNENPKFAIRPNFYPPVLKMKELTCGSTVSGNTNRVSNRLFPMPSCGDFIDKGSAGIWYYIVGTGGTITLSTCNTTTDFDTQIAVFDDCTNFNCIAANNDTSCSNDTTYSSLTFTSVKDKPYYIFVNGREVTDKGLFKLSVICAAIVQPIALDICLALEGPYSVTDATMSTTLVDLGVIKQEYHLPPWEYQGNEGLNWMPSDYPSNSVDWVLVSFRTTTDPSSEIAQTVAILQEDGCLLFPNQNVLPNIDADTEFYVLVEHRNHMAAMSPFGIEPTNDTLSYDFRLADSYSVGTGFGQKQLDNGTWALFAGDADQFDPVGYDITGLDKGVWQGLNGSFNGYFGPDFNLDGDVNGADQIIWFYNNGFSSAVPK